MAKLHPETKKKVRAAIAAVGPDPTIGDPLDQELSGFRKIVLGSWRIVYRHEGATIRIHAVGRRGSVYSDLVERLRSVRERRLTYRRRARVRSVPRAGPRRGQSASSRGSIPAS